MQKIFIIFSFLLILISNIVSAQEFRITGTLLNSDDQQPLPGGVVKLMSARDTIHFKYYTSDIQGNFEFTKLNKGSYILEVTYVGFEKFRKNVYAGGKTENIGKLVIKPSATSLGTVDINATAIRAEQKGDTVQYNADAFKVNRDASTEDLVKKMPGITIENGVVTAHGEAVQKILVDGKQFFGDDPSVTLKNLPAEIVDKIQVFDKLSDQAVWTGFDDGSGQKTMNIVTRNNKNTGQFGKFSAGYGTDDKYLLGANVNFFKGQRRLTILGMSNNVNQQNFSADDVIGNSGSARAVSGGRGGASTGLTAGPQSGIFSTNAIGLNFTDQWGSKLNLNASYFWNNGINTTNKLTDRQYILGGTASQYYNELSNTTTNNTNHRANLRLEYSIDSANSIILTPRFSLQDNNSNSYLNAKTALTPDYMLSNLANSSINTNSGPSSGYNFNNDLLFRHKFSKKGRTISLDLGTGITNRNVDNYVNTQSIFYQQAQQQANDSVNQYGKSKATGLSLSSNIVYTEPIGKHSQVQLNYNLYWSKNDNDKKTYNYADDLRNYTDFDTLLSNVYNNHYITHRIGTGYLYQTPKMNLNGGIAYQYASLDGNTTFPLLDSTHRYYSNVLPNLMFNYKFSKVTNLRLVYRAITNAPSVTQLQKVIDNSNPLLLSTGNPLLSQEMRHSLNARLSHSNNAKTANFFAMMFFQKTQNYIGNSTFRTANDTLINGQTVNKGSQLSVPVNLNGAWNARVLGTVGFPLKPIKSNINFNTGVSYNRLPGMVNGLTNISRTYGYNLGSVLSSNISTKLDFTLTYNISYNLVDNSIQPTLNNNYFYQIGSLQFNWEFWKGFFIQNSVTYQDYDLVSSNISSRYTLWNLNIGKKFLKNKAAEIKLSGYDILGQNKSLTRTVADTYIDDINTEVLQQYFMLTFTYSLRNFNGTNPQRQQNRDGGFDGRPDFRQH